MKSIKKTISITMSLCILFLSVMVFVPAAKAAVQGTITGNEVRFRSAPTINSTIYKYLYMGNVVSINSTDKIAGDGCSDGWYSINYNGTSGTDDIDSYWNSESDNSGPAVSGAREGFKQKNIYDMAGNVWEWTMEKYNTRRVSRGGGYYSNSGSERPASSRSSSDVTGGSSHGRFSCSSLYKVN